MSVHSFLRCVFALSFALLVPATAHAQIFRAYLASDGSDANPCTLAAPCRLLPAALAAVTSGGEIWMLDSANYNASQVTINKSVTILAVPGALGSLVANGGNAINISTNVEVALRNLVIVPLPGGSGTSGISMLTAGALTVENCLIANLPTYGISVSNLGTVQITDSTIRGNGNNGVTLQGGARATITRATISGNGSAGVVVYGSGANTTAADIINSTLSRNANSGLTVQSVSASSVVKVSLRDSLSAANSNGVFVQSTAGASVTVSLSNNTISNSSGDGIVVHGAGAKVWASGNTVSDSSFTGMNNVSGVFESAGNNAVRNNTTNKAGTISVVPME